MRPNQTFKPLTLTIFSAFALSAGTLTFAQNADNDVVHLGNIVVSATGAEQLVEDAPASITVISREDLEKNPTVM